MEGCHILRIWLNINGLYSIYSFTSLLIHKKCGNSIIILKISYWIPGETSEKRLKSKLSALGDLQVPRDNFATLTRVISIVRVARLSRGTCTNLIEHKFDICAVSACIFTTLVPRFSVNISYIYLILYLPNLCSRAKCCHKRNFYNSSESDCCRLIRSAIIIS